jgi:hypothetical protein
MHAPPTSPSSTIKIPPIPPAAPAVLLATSESVPITHVRSVRRAAPLARSIQPTARAAKMWAVFPTTSLIIFASMCVPMTTIPMETSALLAISNVPHALAPPAHSVLAATMPLLAESSPNTIWPFAQLSAASFVRRDSTSMRASPIPASSAARCVCIALELPTTARMGRVLTDISSTSTLAFRCVFLGLTATPPVGNA